MRDNGGDGYLDLDGCGRRFDVVTVVTELLEVSADPALCVRVDQPIDDEQCIFDLDQLLREGQWWPAAMSKQDPRSPPQVLDCGLLPRPPALVEALEQRPGGRGEQRADDEQRQTGGVGEDVK